MFRRRRSREDEIATTDELDDELATDSDDLDDPDNDADDEYDEDEDEYDEDEDEYEDEDEDVERRETVAVEGARFEGPFDIDEVGTINDDEGPVLNLGALLLRRLDGLNVQVEVDQTSRQPIAATLIENNGAVQVHAFAAPRSSGIWDEMRREMAADATRRGGTATELDGPFGRELKVSLPVTTKEGRQGTQVTRLVGVDGPRWMLRGAFVGRAAEPGNSPRLDTAFRDVIVNRGQQPMAPSDLLPLTMPTNIEPDDDPDEQPGRAESPYGPLERGPEITEIH